MRLLHDTMKINLAPGEKRDRAIVSHIVKTTLLDLEDGIDTLIIDKISQQAHGSAIWINMTLQLIEIRELTALNPIRQFLKDMTLPRQLSDLYDDLLVRRSLGDEENQEANKHRHDLGNGVVDVEEEDEEASEEEERRD